MNINFDEIKAQALALIEKVKSDKKILAAVIAGFVLFVIAICVSLGASSFSKPKTPQEQFRATLLGVVNNDKMLDQVIKGFVLSSDKKDLLREHYKLMFDEKLVDFYIKKLDENSVFKDKKLDKKVAFAQAFRILNNISVEGILKTSSKEREAFFRYNELLVNSLSPRVCKMYVVGDQRLFAQKEMQKSGQKIFKKMSYDELKDYLEAQRAAAHSVADGVPSATLTKEQLDKAETLLEDANSKELEKLSDAKQKKIINASSNINKANPIDACEFGKFIYKSVSNITNSDDRELVIIHLLGAQ